MLHRLCSYLLLLTAFLYFPRATGQMLPSDSAWTLQECVSYAQKNNLGVQRARLQSQVQSNNLNTARWDYVPSLSGGANYGFNFGLNIDPVTNQISQQNRQTANLQVSANWTLYNGGRLYKTIARNKLNLQASLQQWEQAKNDIGLNVASGYLQVLLNREIADVAREQVKLTRSQVRRTQALVDVGQAPEGDLYQLEAQLARDQQNLVQRSNQVRMARLRLANLLQLEKPTEFKLAEPELELPSQDLIARPPEQIFQTARGNQPGIRAAELRKLSSSKEVDLARSSYLPSLSLIGQIGTNYSNQIPNVIDTREEFVPIGMVQSTGEVVTTLQPRTFPVTDGVKPLGNQVGDNLNEFVGLNLNIPIFNKMAVKNQVANARINRKLADVDYRQAINDLRQDVFQAHADAKSAFQSLKAGQRSLKASKRAFQYAKDRYEVGALNQLDYETAQNNYIQARSQLAQSKYDFIFRMKVLEFYLTNQVILDHE